MGVDVGWRILKNTDACAKRETIDPLNSTHPSLFGDGR